MRHLVPTAEALATHPPAARAEPPARGAALSVVSLVALCLLTSAWGVAGEAADDWWHPAWASRKRVRVRLPAMAPLDWGWRPPAEAAQDIVAAEAAIRAEQPLKAGAQREIRVVDAGGNVLPALVSGPDTRGLIRVTFPARRTIVGQLASAIGEGAKTAELAVGRDRAVTAGMRFHVMAGFDRVATLEVAAVADHSATARVLAMTVPQIAKGTAVRSKVLTGADYFIYYGNPEPKDTSPTWAPPAAPVRRYTWQITGGAVPTSPPMLRQVMRQGVRYVGASSLEAINTRSNPHVADLEGYCMAAYESYVRVELPGLYRFSIDSTGSSYLFVDGRFVAERSGFHMQHGQWEHRGKVELDAGVHHLVMVAGESSKRLMTRLGWQPITAKVYTQTPASFYVTRVPAEAVGYDTRERRGQVFFTCTQAPRAVLVGGKGRCQFVQFHNHTPADEADEAELTWGWEFPEGETRRDRAPGRLFALAEGSTAAAFPVTLRAFRDGKLAGDYQRTVHCDPRPAQRLLLSVDVVSFANIVYDDERTSIAVRLRNANLSPILLRAVARVRTQGDEHALRPRRILIPAEGEDFYILPVDMKRLERKRAVLELDLFLAGQRVHGTALGVIPSPEGLAGLRRGLGALFDAQDRRVMICAEIEDRDRHLRWVFYNYLRDEVVPRSRKTRRRVLLFGDRMANAVGPADTFTDYTALLAQRLEADGRQLQVVARSTGLLPTLADLILFARTLDAAKPMPDIIILSPGLADVAQASGVRDFTRSIDVMIDAVRARAPRTKILIVSPPPYPGNPRLSAHYTQALKTLASHHHYPFLDLDALLAKAHGDWVDAWFAAPGADGIFLANPNEQAHRRIADALFKLVY